MAQLARNDSKEIALVEAGAPVLDTSQDVKTDHGLARDTAFVGLSRLQSLRRFWRACFFCGVCVFGVLMDGFQYSLPGGVLANTGFIKQFGTVVDPATGALALDAQYISSWAGVAYAGQFSAQYVAGYLSDRFGRRSVLWLFTASMAIGLIIECVSRTWVHWLVAKLFMGFGQGLCQHGILTYIAEIAPAQIRGFVLSTYGFGFALGQLFAAIALQAVEVSDPENWLKAIYSQWVSMGLWLICVPFIPETPWYYVRKEQGEKAKKVMRRIFKNVEGYEFDYEYNIMVEQIEHERRELTENAGVGWKDIFTGVHLRRSLAGVFCLAMQNWSGSPVVFNYTSFFLQQAGIPEPFQATCIVYCILLGAIVISFYTVERFGRRALTLIGGVGSLLFNVLLGVFGLLVQTSAVQSATLAMICLWVVLYAICFAGSGWTVASEIATPRLRAKSTAFIVSTNAISGAIFNTTVPLMLSSSGNGAKGWGLKTLFMFAILSALGTVFNYYLLPETKGRTFGEMDEMYEARVPPRKMQAFYTSVERSGQKKHNK